MQSPRGGIGNIQQFGYRRILYVILNTAYHIALTRMQVKGGAQLLAFNFLIHINRCA